MVCTHAHSLMLFFSRSLYCILLWKSSWFDRWEKPHKNGDKGEGEIKHELVPYLKASLKSDVWGSCWKCDICLGPLFTWVSNRCSLFVLCTAWSFTELLFFLKFVSDRAVSSAICLYGCPHALPWALIFTIFLSANIFCWYLAMLVCDLDPPKTEGNKLFRRSHSKAGSTPELLFFPSCWPTSKTYSECCWGLTCQAAQHPTVICSLPPHPPHPVGQWRGLG